MKDLIVFDMDGVLVEVSESYRATIQATVKHFTNYEPTGPEIQDWKNKGGWNDDWQLSHRLIQEQGGDTPYQTVVDHFQQIFHGDGTNGLIRREQWIAGPDLYPRLAAGHNLAIFTGRLRWEANITLKNFNSEKFFCPVVGCDDVTHSKPNPEGLIRIVNEVEHGKAWYIGDTVDDAHASSAAKVPFIGIAAPANPRYHQLVSLLKAEGAVAILDDINSLEAALAAHS